MDLYDLNRESKFTFSSDFELDRLEVKLSSSCSERFSLVNCANLVSVDIEVVGGGGVNPVAVVENCNNLHSIRLVGACVDLSWLDSLPTLNYVELIDCSVKLIKPPVNLSIIRVENTTVHSDWNLPDAARIISFKNSSLPSNLGVNRLEHLILDGYSDIRSSYTNCRILHVKAVNELLAFEGIEDELRSLIIEDGRIASFPKFPKLSSFWVKGCHIESGECFIGDVIKLGIEDSRGSLERFLNLRPSSLQVSNLSLIDLDLVSLASMTKELTVYGYSADDFFDISSLPVETLTMSFNSEINSIPKRRLPKNLKTLEFDNFGGEFDKKTKRLLRKFSK